MFSLSLPVISDRDDVQFSNEQGKALASAIAGAKSMKQACRIIRKVANALPALGKEEWKRQLLALADALDNGTIAYEVFSLDGNGKLPFVAFSVLPFVSCPGMGDCATFCYSVKAWRTPGSYCRQLQNTILMMFRRDIVASAFEAIPAGILRLYVDGDFDSVETIDFWMTLLHSRPDVDAYGYSKSWNELALWGDLAGNVWPANYCLNTSSGGKEQDATLSHMSNLPITRGEFVALPVHYVRSIKGKGKPTNAEKYSDPNYIRACRDAAEKAGYGRKIFICPGDCGNCSSKGHVCGSHRFDGVPVVIGVH